LPPNIVDGLSSSLSRSDVSENGAFGAVDDIDAKEPMTLQTEALDPLEGFLVAGDGDTNAIKDADSDIGRRIAEAREAAGMERLTFGKRVGVRPETVAAWETGHRRPRSNRLATIAGVLGVGISWLMIGHGDSPSEQDDLAGIAPEIAAIRAELELLVARLDRLAGALPAPS
jgi:transcriptional regulator with XRE-family HTH domain